MTQRVKLPLSANARQNGGLVTTGEVGRASQRTGKRLAEPQREVDHGLGGLVWVHPDQHRAAPQQPRYLEAPIRSCFFFFNRGHSSAQRAADQPTLLFFVVAFFGGHIIGQPNFDQKKEKKKEHARVHDGGRGRREERKGREEDSRQPVRETKGGASHSNLSSITSSLPNPAPPSLCPVPAPVIPPLSLSSTSTGPYIICAGEISILSFSCLLTSTAEGAKLPKCISDRTFLVFCFCSHYLAAPNKIPT